LQILNFISLKTNDFYEIRNLILPKTNYFAKSQILFQENKLFTRILNNKIRDLNTLSPFIFMMIFGFVS
jgi:hypothetical protein